VPDATPERKKGREEGSFTGDEFFTSGNGGTEVAA
jgi:hypothetical protein